MLLISKNLIDINYFALDKKSCLQDLAELFFQNSIIQSKTSYLEKIWEREELMSTGIGHKIAIPHARSATVNKLAVAFFRLANELDYDSIDDEPVKLIFMIAVPDQMNSNYMQVLKAIGNYCHDQKNIDKLISAQSNEEAEHLLQEIAQNIEMPK